MKSKNGHGLANAIFWLCVVLVVVHIFIVCNAPLLEMRVEAAKALGGFAIMGFAAWVQCHVVDEKQP